MKIVAQYGFELGPSGVCVHEGRGLAQFFGGGRSQFDEEVDAENLCLSPSDLRARVKIRERLPSGLARKQTSNHQNQERI